MPTLLLLFIQILDKSKTTWAFWGLFLLGFLCLIWCDRFNPSCYRCDAAFMSHERNVVSGEDSSLYGLLALVKNSQPESYYSILGVDLHLKLVFNYFNQQTR